jgi:hypothetical protein
MNQVDLGELRVPGAIRSMETQGVFTTFHVISQLADS